jgi:ketosteroid isomerase-like protein
MSDPLDVVAQLQALTDERAIVDTLYQWSDCFYQADWEGVLECFTDTATFSMTRSAGAPPNLELAGRADLERWFAEHEERVPGGKASQVLAQPRVVVEGDSASAKSFFVVIHNIDDAPTLFSTGRFHDRLERGVDGRWRLAERVGVGEMRRKPTS